MNAAKAYRKLKEVEETKLSNRLMLLRLELARSEKKIDETTKRADAIRSHAQALEERNQHKMEFKRKKQEELAMAQQINQIARTRMTIIRRVRNSAARHGREALAAPMKPRRRCHV